ncbi:hypothetical protein EG327_009299 [Venturia inaequalis]|uniref:Class II aldolase/adducin N-terminal domain-containing protein n=1 Tax=Venturia inaequalis TaxID=5025 RepID=A0A8H3VNY3_VENIN|nr:hypothetical protein EG327_009299 [Venturia inaequalis]
MALDWYSDPKATAAPDWSKQDLKKLRHTLITANHILHHHSIVDAYGHISIRHPQNPDIYIMCGYMAPGVVSSSDDLIEYYIKDSSPVDPDAKKGYSERFIHGEMFRKWSGVNCVIHSHAEDVLPFVTSGVPLVPVFHMAGFLGTDVPIFDIAKIYEKGEQQDLLVRNARIGTHLASTFAKSNETDVPEHTVVLMRRHGYTTHGPSIESAVYRAIYTKINASIQTSAMTLKASSNLTPKFEFEPLTEEMCKGCVRMNEGTQDKPWRLWCLEVEKAGLYVNKG